MQIQVNSSNHIEGNIRLDEWVRSTLHASLERFEDDLTRIEVHLRDENGIKPGPHDKRCQMEARPKGHQPISVTHTATSLDQAVDGAAGKLNNALEHFYGKLRSKRGALELSDPDA
ncbi:HPF/RaiA family ribosome-associated protein [Pseudomonas entomophila]|uniref:HPF/RaiA family ribosome-associated protein n=1 Tax=Pseudomonas entomophila TaxID=312306 RepID=UPI002405A468|nr:HPF/RaiA family ribosome-associated protein [Pseudomonas entomophila]MDF9618624.1 HPF/RaiA family ribosome-associated protein [Pseudomonas entomophila]